MGVKRPWISFKILTSDLTLQRRLGLVWEEQLKGQRRKILNWDAGEGEGRDSSVYQENACHSSTRTWIPYLEPTYGGEEKTKTPLRMRMCTVISIETGERKLPGAHWPGYPRLLVSSRPVSNLVSKDKVDGAEERHSGLHLLPPHPHTQSLDKLKRSWLQHHWIPWFNRNMV